jgi:hypothetical protein
MRTIPDYIGVFAFDPGGTTGVAWSMMKVHATVAETLQAAEVFSQDVTGDHREQAVKLDELLMACEYEWTVERALSAGDIYVVSEGFSLHKIGSREKVGLYPVWVAAMFEGLVHGRHEVVYQEPSEKKYATSARMKRWGLWRRGGSEHEKDARRHIAIRLNKII